MTDTASPPVGASDDAVPTTTRREALRLDDWLKVGAGVAGVAALASACDAVGDSGNPDMLLMKRATYGVTQEVIDRVGQVGAAAWIAEQLDHQTLDTTAIDTKVAALAVIGSTAAQLQATYGNQTQEIAGQLAIATSMRQMESPAQLYERMVEFWSDHLNVPTSNNVLRYLKPVEDREVIRPHALGKFKDLIVASAQSPAMLYYLDNALSFAGNINENYARELLELHTVGVNGGYTEADIVAVADLLTGWSIEQNTGLFEFRLAQHDTSSQSILGWNRPGDTDYLDHGVQFLQHLALLPATAEFICTKLIRRFVTDMPDPTMVADLAAVYLANDSDIKPVLTALFAHPTFLGSEGQKLRRPQEFLIAIGRQVDAEFSTITSSAQIGPLGATAVSLGQPPFQWPAPNGYPDVGPAWLNAGGLLGRWNAAADLATGYFGVMNVTTNHLRDGIGVRPVGEQFDIVADRLLHEPLTDDGRHVLAIHLGVEVTDVEGGVWLFENIDAIVALLLSTADNQYT
ncbi:MAG: DUF1800 domain-containing protein [Actinomycetota bacterium]